MRRTLLWAAVLIATLTVLVLLWPAQFGGVTGLTVVEDESVQSTFHEGDLVVSMRQPTYAAGDLVSVLVPSGQPGAGDRVLDRVIAVSVAQPTGATEYWAQKDTTLAAWAFHDDDVLGKATITIPFVGPVVGSQAMPLFVSLGCAVIVSMVVWRRNVARRRADG